MPGLMLAAYAKWLARRSSCDQVNRTEISVLNRRGISLQDLPIGNPGNSLARRILPKGIASVLVPLQQRLMMKSGQMGAERSPPAPVNSSSD